MVRLALLPAAAFSGGTAHAAGPAKAGDGDALAACDVRMEQAEAVVPGTGEPLFLSADGTRYFASDVRFPGRGGEHMAPVSRNDLSADSDFAAVPAGPPNRWGLVPAWIVLREAGGSHLWQARQLEAGHALFAPDRATADCADALRRAEGRARRAHAGIFGRKRAGPIYSAARPGTFKETAGRYVIIRGRIVSLGKTARTRYLNFGKYWKTDVTGTLNASDEEDFNAALERAGWSLDALAGRYVEMRGIVEHRDGPLIALRHPEQLVVLDDKRAGRDGQGNN
ncbi:hypothetical protein [Roseibium sp. Sym1]|uniref:hypothetical protein n=1 Tax=Roseibium sp. Sym1 TaxID=3016006 RepID=UPI0022B4BBD1|nr:hypothetical protein [Roseibium sp. Sym1]